MQGSRARAALFSALGFAVFSAGLLVVPTESVDRFLSEFFQWVIPSFLDPFLSVFSLLGAFEVHTGVLLGVLLSLRVGWRKFLVYFGVYTLGMVVEVLGKSYIWHPGPTKELFRYDLPFVFASSHVQTWFAYPSGHSYRSVYFALLFLWELEAYWGRSARYLRWARWTAAALAVMLLSRVSLGEHWTTDVIGGVLLGIACAGYAWRYGRKSSSIKRIK